MKKGERKKREEQKKEMVLSAATSSSAAAAAAKRALSLYRSLLRAARSLPARQDRESLEEETKRRFRAERDKGAAAGSGSRAGEVAGSGGDRGGEGKGARGGGGEGEGEEVALAALFDEAEARLHDARHHGIPFARLEHAAQIPRAVLESARELLRGGEEGREGAIKLPRDKSARAKLEAAVERRRVKKRQLEEGRQDRSNND